MIFCCTNVYPGRKLACLMNANYIVTSLVKVNSQQLLLLYSDPQDHRHLLGHLRRQHQHLSRSSFRKLFVELFRSICRHDALHYQPICSASVENAGRKMIWTCQQRHTVNPRCTTVPSHNITEGFQCTTHHKIEIGNIYPV